MSFSLRNENYLNIQGWMVSELELKGNELIIYAVIYGFSQDGTTAFGGSLSYLMQWTKASKPTVINCLKSLIDKGLVVKHEYVHNGVKMCEYTALCDRESGAENDASDDNNADLKDTEIGGKEILPGVKNFNQGGKET
ncbi:MAG: helix-turn-helix domain-containing protein, partial [Christensenellaceae bacterium]|nr:helix-turn-helix domain-containing protein [Christensenellaceae bacterium]